MSRKIKTTSPLHKQAEADLARSGITLEEADDLGIVVIDKNECAALGHTQPDDAILFQYWDPFAEEFQDVEEFHRVRLIGTPTGFAAQVKGQRYSQPPGTLNSVYIPRIVDGTMFDWRKFLKDPTGTLYITEGEKKAIAACKAGVPTLGLGGVTMFQSQKRGTFSLPLLDKVDWRGRDVGIVFDTDTAQGLKPDVLRAAERLLDWLLLKGSRPFLVTLPSSGEKVGLDDYFLKHGKIEFELLVAEQQIKHDDAVLLTRAACQYQYVQDIDRFVGEDPHQLYQTQHLDRVLGMKQVAMLRMEKGKDPNGRPTTKWIPKPLPLAEALIIWPGTETFKSMTYAPGQERTIWTNDRPYLNLWSGWKCEYKKEELPSEARRAIILREWMWAMDNVFADDAVAREFAEHWLMYPLKYPGAKLNTFALVCSREEGIGKSFLGHMLAKHVYGLTKPGPRHAWQLAEGDLAGQFNPYMFATSFVEGDDIASHDKKSVYERVKSFVTSDTIQINTKNNPQFMMENRCNFWLTSNDAAPFYLNEASRRAFIHIPRRAKKDRERYVALMHMFESGEAGPTLLHYAREKYNEGSFIPSLDAPLTEGKKEIALNSRTGSKEWVYDLIQHSDMLTRPVATAREIMALIEQENVQGKVTSESIGHHLRDAGAIRWRNGMQINIMHSDGTVRRERIWVLGDFAEVDAMTREKLEEMFKLQFGYTKGQKVVPLKQKKF